MKNITLTISFPKSIYTRVHKFVITYENWITIIVLSVISIISYWTYYANKLGLAYNDARSHLDIGRRVVEGLKPGLAQLGSVWLPLNHILMIPTIWNDFMWHSGLAGALQSMISFVVTGYVIGLVLKKLRVGFWGRISAIALFAANINILYLQSTAMTELLLISTMTLGVYELIRWHEDNTILSLIKASFWIMLSTLVRYDGWFLLFYATCLVISHVWRKKGYRSAEGTTILFLTLAAVGIVFWFLWNQMIFKDALYFALGPFSAHTQQEQMSKAGVLITKNNWWLSTKVYLYALLFNSYTYPSILGLLGSLVLWFDRSIKSEIRIATTAYLAPLLFNILALFLGFSVLFVQGISGNTWFNVRYGIMMMPSIAIFVGYLIDRAKSFRYVLVGSLCGVLLFAFANHDAVTIDDARVGSSQKNVTEVTSYLKKYAANQTGFILISAASHDAIVFSSGLPMKRFIHEGTGKYWESATAMPDQWARWIVMRTYDDNDLTWKSVRLTSGFKKYTLVAKYPFADVYELKPEYIKFLKTEPVYGKQK